MAQPARNSLVIVPTYNEIENLEPLVLQVLAQEPALDVLVVDDSSPDGTGLLADALARQYPERVVVLHRPAKLGLGTAYVQGFRYALATGYQHVYQMDADLSHDPASLPRFGLALEAFDVVLGSRWTPGGGAQGWPLHRRVLSRGGSLYARLALGLPYSDLTSGFKGFRRSALERLPLDAIRSTGYAFQLEVTYLCHRLGMRIAEVPILFADRRNGDSKLGTAVVLEALWRVWQVRLAKAALPPTPAARRPASAPVPRRAPGRRPPSGASPL